MGYIYSVDGTKKVNIDTATLLGDVASELEIYQQGDRTQLWRSANGSYFTGSCLDHWCGSNKIPRFRKFVPMSKAAAKAWVIEYYGSNELENFGFVDDAEEI